MCRPTGLSVHTHLSRGVPADHEARSQVKQKTAAKVKALEEGLTRKTIRIAEFTGVSRSHVQTRETSHQHT